MVLSPFLTTPSTTVLSGFDSQGGRRPPAFELPGSRNKIDNNNDGKANFKLLPLNKKNYRNIRV